MQTIISPSDLILNEDGSVYHLNLLPGELAETIILVGDPDRVPEISKYFDRIEVKKHKREYNTHTGFIGKKRISVISTGIGAGDIDIVMNEVDALFNIHLKTRTVKDSLTKLQFIRLGTTGTVAEDIPVDSLMVSTHSFSTDGVLKFYSDYPEYRNEELSAALKKHFQSFGLSDSLVVANGSDNLIQKFGDNSYKGITFTCTGFYGPQGRPIRAGLSYPDFLNLVKTFEFDENRIINMEMETNLIYGLSNLLGHDSCSISTAIVNRTQNTTSSDIKKSIDNMIRWALGKIERV